MSTTTSYDPTTGKTTTKQTLWNGQEAPLAGYDQSTANTVAYPPASSAITPASMAPATPIVPVIATDYNAPTLPVPPAPVVTTPEPTPSPLTSRIDELTASLYGDNGLNDQSIGRSAYKSQQLSASPVQDLRGQQVSQQKVVDMLNADVNASLQKEQNINLQNERLHGQGIAKGIVSIKGNEEKRQLQIDRNQNYIDNRYATASLSAIQGNLANAIKAVDEAVSAKFDPIDEQIRVKIANLEGLKNSPAYIGEVKKRADEQTAILEKQKQDALDARKNTQDTADARIKALGQFTNDPKLTPSVIAQLQAAKTPLDVAGILQIAGLSTIAKPKAETQLTKLDNGETVLVDTQTGKIISHLGGQKAPEAPTGSSNVVLDGKPVTVNNDALSYAQQYASTGKLPSPAELKLSGLNVSQVTEIAKGLPKPNGALIDNNTGVKPSSLSAAQEQGITAMNEIVTKSLPQLQALFPKLYTGLIGGIVGGALPSQDRSDYNTLRADFLSKLLVARSGAAVTEQEYARYADLLPTTFNQIGFFGTDGEKKLASLAKSMQSNLDNTANTLQVGIVGYTDVKKQLEQLSAEQKAELDKEGLLPAWAK